MAYGSTIGASETPTGQTSQANTAEEVEAQQAPDADTFKKWKEIDARSIVWKHFEKVKDASGVTQKGKCICFTKKLNAHPKIHGTSSLQNHILSCTKFSHCKDTR